MFLNLLMIGNFFLHPRIGNRIAVGTPGWFVAGMLLCIMISIIRVARSGQTALEFQFTHFFSSSPRAVALLWIKRLLYLLLLLGSFRLLSAPKRIHQTTDETKKGIDIVLALDISYSMEANDFAPNRLEAAKKALTDFLATRRNDRIGLVVFAGKPFTSIPLTFDYGIFQEILGRTTTATIDQGYQHLQGTAVGDAILSSITLLQK